MNAAGSLRNGILSKTAIIAAKFEKCRYYHVENVTAKIYIIQNYFKISYRLSIIVIAITCYFDDSSNIQSSGTRIRPLRVLNRGAETAADTVCDRDEHAVTYVIHAVEQAFFDLSLNYQCKSIQFSAVWHC